MNNKLNEEWEKFISSSNYEEDDIEDDIPLDYKNMYDNNIDFIDNENIDVDNPPASTPIYISTKSKISYLNQQIDYETIFWNINIIPYWTPICGIIKKQIKMNTLDIDSFENMRKNIEIEKNRGSFVEENIIVNINNPNGRIKFKDSRKISVGLSKKDILSYQRKKKGAFYNCFVLIFRLKQNDTFNEYHVKVFNTGKVEMPGIKNDETFSILLVEVIHTLQPFIKEKLFFKDNPETILINSNFNCGYFIDREKLHKILKFKYNIQSIFEGSYPGIQCKFYYNPDKNIIEHDGCYFKENNINAKKISFMIFRTGSVLIVGKCDEYILYCVYEYLKNIFIVEFSKIFQKNIGVSNEDHKNKIKKNRKKKINIMEFL
jgi:hypothetical protein